MTFEYKSKDLGGLSQPGLEATLNKLGAEGWELVAVLAPQVAIFKRSNRVHAPERQAQQPAMAKYRDPVTGETWSGRGRMATWLAERVKAGAKLGDFLA